MSSPRWMAAAGLIALLGSTAPARAELNSCDLHPCVCHMYQTGDTPDPFPWGVALGNGRGAPVNPNGDQRGDLWPDFGVNPADGQAEVVWAYNDGNDHEIGFAETVDGHWSPIKVLTNNSVRDIDPRLAFSPATGGTKIVYWSQEPVSRVKLVERATPTSAWGMEETVSDGLNSARLPAVAISQGIVFIGYEQDVPTGGKDILLVMRADVAGFGLNFARQVVGHTAWSGSARVTVDVANGGELVYAAWLDSDVQIAYSLWTGSVWTMPQFIPYTGTMSVDDVRIAVRRQVLTLVR